MGLDGFLNDNVYNGTPSYPASGFPPSWHISCENAANNVQLIACDKCFDHDNNKNDGSLELRLGSCFPFPGDGNGFPTGDMWQSMIAEEQLEWLESDEARALFHDYLAELNT